MAAIEQNAMSAAEPVKKQPMDQKEYANQLMAERADSQRNQYENLTSDLKNAAAGYKGRATGVSTWDNFNPAQQSGKDPLSKEERKKLGIIESWFEKTPVIKDLLRWAEAESIARSRIDPVYQQQLNNTLKQINITGAKRGLFGQTPTEALKAQAVADAEARRTENTFGLALDLMAKDEQSKQAQWNMETQRYMGTLDNLWRDLGYVGNAFDKDWEKNYKSWQESYNQYYQQQLLAQALAAASSGGGGGGGGGGGSEQERRTSNVSPSGYYNSNMQYVKNGVNTSYGGDVSGYNVPAWARNYIY